MFLPAFVARILTPLSRQSGYDGLLLGCRSGPDAGPFEKTYIYIYVYYIFLEVRETASVHDSEGAGT